MKAADSKREALNALRFMTREWRADHCQTGGAAFGYAWASLSAIADIPSCPLPHFVGPPRREHAPAFEPWNAD